jgi:hypothetical protein
MAARQRAGRAEAEEVRLRHSPGAQAVSYKKTGCCSLCDTECFDVLQRWDQGEKLAGEPKRLGKACNGATRITFRLIDGTLGDFTFCSDCASSLHAGNYAKLWAKNLAAYMRQQNGDPSKFLKQFDNGILSEVGRQSWEELQCLT